MTDSPKGGISLIKLGKMANSKEFGKLADLWDQALENEDYTWRELVPIAGQVGRQGAEDRAEALIESLVGWVEENGSKEKALEAARLAGLQLPQGKGLHTTLVRLYTEVYDDYLELPDLLDLLMPKDKAIPDSVPMVDRYVLLKPGSYVTDGAYTTPGIVEEIVTDNGVVTVRFGERHNDYGPATITKLKPRPTDHFPSVLQYDPDRLRELAETDALGFVNMALKSNRDGLVMYRDLKNNLINLIGEKGWKSWWTKAKIALKRDPMIGMGGGSQPTIRRLRQADRYEDRLRREFDFAKEPQAKLLKVMAYVDEASREDKRKEADRNIDNDLLLHFGNGAAKVAMSVLQTNPSLTLAGLALHSEIAARGIEVARPNPKAAVRVLGKLKDPGTLALKLPESLLQRVLRYLKDVMPEQWGEVWAAIATRSGKRMSDYITRTLIENKQSAALEKTLLEVLRLPTGSPDLMCWMWKSHTSSGASGKFLAELDSIDAPRIADGMFALLDAMGRLYGISQEERHLKVLEDARIALANEGNRPVFDIMKKSERPEIIRIKAKIEKNAGIAAAHRTQLLGYLRNDYPELFLEVTSEWEDESIIYATENGIREADRALNFIVEVEVPEVAKQIGEAAAHGDLSENSEYTAALEKRDQLASRCARMKGELEMAKVINFEMAGSDFVNIGTKVTAISGETGEEEVYTFLGPWDTDTENKVLNYRAPLSMAFMGVRVGEQVKFGEGDDLRTWNVTKIESAL